MKKMIMMLIVLLVAIAGGVSGSAFGADAEGRTAVIVDTAGVTSEVSAISTSGENIGRFRSKGIVAVLTKPFEIAIPLSACISIEVKGGAAEVRYQLEGQQRVITGPLEAVTFSGQMDFGEFSLPSDKLRKLAFKEGPDVMREGGEGPFYDATLELKDGTKVRVTEFERHDSFWERGVIFGTGATGYYYYTDFRFLRGESLLTVDFKDIRRIEFGPNQRVTITLNNGKSATGTLLDQKGAGVKGFVGLFDKGEFFIEPSYMKAIEFGAK